MGLGMPIPDLSNKPGPGRPGYPTGAYEFQFEVTDNVTFKAIANSAGTFSISYPDGTTTTTSGSSSITSQGGAGIISINKEEGDTTFCDEFAIVGNKDKVIKVVSWGQRTWNKLQDAFKDCTNLTEISTTSLTTDTVGNLNNLFSGCTSLTDVSIKGWSLLSGCSIEGLFDGCTNIEKLDATGLILKIKANSRSIFKLVGSTVTNGCEFLMSGLDFSTSTSMTFGDTSGNGMFQQTKIKPNSDFSNWNLTSSATTQLNSVFLNAKILGDNSTLNISNWTLLGSASSRVNGFFNNFETSDGTNRGLNINITNWNFGNVYSVADFFKNCDLSTVTGLSTLTASNIQYLNQFFQFAKYLSIPSADNLSSSFRNAVNAVGGGFNNFAQNLGSSLTNESDWGAFPNIDGFNLSSATVFSNIFAGGRYSTEINLGNVTFPATAVSLSGLFSGVKLSAGNGIDLTTTTLKSSNFQNFLQNTVADFMKMGTGVDWTSVTTMYGFNQNWNLTRPGGAVANSIELPTGLNISSLNALGLWGIDANYSQCQIDNFIRSMWLYQRPPVPSTPTLNFSGGTGLTAAPMAVRNKVDDLITAGWNFNGEVSPDITAPFAYTGSFLINTNITPTINTSGGTFSSSDVTVDSSTGTFNKSTAGSVTIKYTLPNGCYNEQVLSVVPPFTPFKFRVTGPISIKAQPAVAGSFTIDWGDGTSQTTTGSNSIASPSYPAGTYDVQINAQSDATYCDNFEIVSGETNVTEILDWGEKPWNNLSQSFKDCSNLTSLSNTTLTTASSCSLTYAFNSCTSLQTINLTNWNLSQGVALAYCFQGTTNVEEIDATNSNININTASNNIFDQVGTQTTNGCLFKMSGVNLSNSTNTVFPNMFYGSRIKKDSTFANWVFPSGGHSNISFRLVIVPMQDTTLDCSGWTTYSATSFPDFQQVNFSYGGYGVAPTSSTGLKIDITNLNVSNVSNIAQKFYYSFQDEIIGLSTLGATNGATSMSIMFAYNKFMKFTAANNFSNAFISSLNLSGSSAFNQTFRSQGSAVPDAGAGVAPNLSGLDLSNTNGLDQAFLSAKYSNALDFTNVTMNASTSYSFNAAFYGCKFLDGGNVNSLFSKTFKVSSLNQAFRSARMGSIIFGSNVDLSPNDTLFLTFYEFGLDIASPTIEFADNVSFANVQNFDRPFYSVGTTNTPLSTCQVDNFIRRLQATRPTAGAITNKTVNFYNSAVTESPSLVRGLADTLVNTGGYILDLFSTDATIPFQYGTDLGPNTSITPTNNTGSAFTGTFSSSNSNIAVNSTTGLINTSNTGNTTIRYTLADGCFTEQAITVSDPFKLKLVIPTDDYNFVAATTGGSGFDYNIDWGDGNSTTGINSNVAQAHTYATAGTYYIKIYSDNKDGYNGFASNTGSAAIQEIVSWGDLKWTTMQRSFYNCTGLTTTPSSFTLPLRSGAVGVRTREAFRGCTNLNSVNLDGIKIYQDARYMFYLGLNNIQSFSMDNVEFHDPSDANSAADMFTGFGQSNTTSWASFNLDNWTWNNPKQGVLYNLLGATTFYFSNEEISLTNWSFTNVPSGIELTLRNSLFGLNSSKRRKGAADEKYILNLSNWSGTSDFDLGVDFYRSLKSAAAYVKGFKTNNWDDNTKINDMFEFAPYGQMEYWEGLDRFIAHETVGANFFTNAFLRVYYMKFESIQNSFKPSFFQNITNSFSMHSSFEYFSNQRTQSEIESDYSGAWDFLGSINSNCNSLAELFFGAKVLGPIDFGSSNLSGVTTYYRLGQSLTIYSNNKIDFSGVTIDGNTIISDFKIYGPSTINGTGRTVDFNSANINFSGLTNINFGLLYGGVADTFVLPPTLTFSSTNFTGNVFLTSNNNYGPLLSPSDYSKLLIAISTQTTHSNGTIQVGSTGYQANPTLPSTVSSDVKSIGANTTPSNYDGGTNNAPVTLESDGYNLTSPPTGGTAASVGNLAIAQYYTGSPLNYSFVTAIFTTNNTNDSFATNMDNFTTGASWAYRANIITNSVGTAINNIVNTRGWTMTDGEIGDRY